MPRRAPVSTRRPERHTPARSASRRRDESEPTREALEADEDRRLAPYAMRSCRARRQRPVEREGRVFDYRTEFQRDRDRILHCRAFRRLRLKSDGGALPPGERHRDRLTHTLEVSQLSRTVARGLGLNEDLVEAIALGHELGMPPFGRAGEAALDALLGERAGGFKYPCQSLRVTDRLEKRYEHPGINLTDSTREGILKHAPHERATAATVRAHLDGGDTDPLGDLRMDLPPFFEAQVVAAVDQVASLVQDLDDGVRAGDVDLGSVEGLPIVKELSRRIQRQGDPVKTAASTGAPRRGELFMRANAINRGLTHMLVAGIIHQSRQALLTWSAAHDIRTHEQFLASRTSVPPGTIGLTPAAMKMYDGLRSFVARGVHQGRRLSGVAVRAGHLISGLFQSLRENPRAADDYLLLRFKEENGGPYLRDLAGRDIETEITRRYRTNPRYARLVADHIAGMTDPFALAEHARLTGSMWMEGGTYT